MYKLLVLLIFITGVSARGVPAADEPNGGHEVPKRSETDRKDHPSEHVTLEECEDCTKVNGNDKNGAEGDTPQDKRNDKIDDLEVASQTPKPKIKPFLSFHRIKVKVNKRRKTDRNSSRKDRRRHHNRKSDVSHQKNKQLSDVTSDEQASYVEKSSASKRFETNDKSKQTETKVSVTTHKLSEELNIKTRTDTAEVQIQGEKTSNRATTQGLIDIQINTVTEENGSIKHDSNYEKKGQNLNDKKSVDRQIKEKLSEEEKNTSLNISTLKGNTSDVNLSKVIDRKNKQFVEKSDIKDSVNHVGVKPKDEKDSFDSDGVKPKPKDEKDSVDHTGVNQKPIYEKDYVDDIRVKPKDDKDPTDHIVKPNNGKASSDPDGVKQNSEQNSVDHIIGKPKDEKGSVDHVIPKKAGDRWSRKDLSQVPDVERLERRLHPTVDAPVQDIIQSMKNMLRLIQTSIIRVDDDYKMIHNTTRWKYMVGVRDQLTELAEKNDQIYDVVLEASLLTKEIYRKAHERKHPRVDVEAVAVSYRSRLNTDMHTQMHKNFYAAQKELEMAKHILEQIKSSRKQKESLSDEKVRLYHVVRDRLPLRSLHDLYRRADQTINILTSAQPLSRSGDKERLYAHMRNDTALNMKSANDLTADGRDLLGHAKRVLMENKQKAQEYANRVRNRLPAGVVADMPFDSGRMDLFVAWDEANHHANSLSDRAAEIHMKLVPLINKAKEVMASRKGVGFQKLLDQSSQQLKETVKTLLDVLDQIRLMFGDDRVLTERCEVLQNAKYFPHTPINCDQYITIDVSSGDGEMGSGDFDDTIVDMEITDTTGSNVTNEELPIDIDITNEKATAEIMKSQTESPKAPKKNDTESSQPAKKDQTESPQAAKKDQVESPQAAKNDQTESPRAASTIEDIDDEDRAQELKIKLTKKTSPVTASPPTTTTTSGTTGSSDGSDEDLFFDPFGWFKDEPDGDSVVIDSNDDFGLFPVPENKTLNELIRERLYNYSEGSKELLETADTTKTKMKEVSLTWQKVQNRFSTLENKTYSAISVISKWKAEKAYFYAVHDRIESVDKDIGFRKEIVDAQCSDAVKQANKKLQTMTEVYEKQSEKAKNAADPTDVNEAVSQVKVVVDDVNEITRLKQLYPTPCSTLETLDRKIRSNITELRKKIERAKLIASSLQIAVAVPKKEYIEFPISKDAHESHPLTSHVQVMLKHSGSNGRLVSLHVGKSESVALEVKDDELTVIQSIDGEEKSLPLYEDNMTDKWYLIQLQRFAAGYNFTMFGDKGMLSKVGTVASVDDYRKMSPDLLPTSLRLGTSGDLSACALGLEIDGRSVNMFDMGDNESIPTTCSSQGRWTSHQPNLLLDGSGYALIRLTDLPTVRTLKSIKVSFNPRSDGTVVLLKPRRMATEIDVYVEKGFLIVFVHYRQFESKLKSTGQVYSTDQVLEIVFKDGNTKSAAVVLNGKSNVFKTAKGKKREMKTNSQDIFIGGIPFENSSMVGCLKSLELNGEVVPFQNMHKAEGNSFGTCRKTECVKFDENSIPIEIENRTRLQSIHVSVKRGSLGPILTYSKHKEKFNLIVSLNTEGLSIEETVDEKTEDISLNGDSDFIVVAIQDDTESQSVTVTVGEATEEFSYKKGGDGWGGWGGNGDDKKDDGPVSYSVSLGTSADDSSDDYPPFLGTIQNFILDGRPVELLNYLETNKLGRCTLDPATRKQETHDAVVKGITCK